VPLYQFRCRSCGPFDLGQAMQNASNVASCPSCSQTARRIYSSPAIRLEKRPLRDATRADRQRLDRARSGEPVITSRPSGRRFPNPNKHHH